MSIRDNPDDWAMLHYAVGIMEGLASKYGVIDVLIYYDDIAVKITSGVRKDGKGEPRADGGAPTA